MYELRNKKNISQEDLAEVLDVSRQSISKWENDKAYPEMTRLLFMSDYFDVSLDYLMRGIDKEDNEGKVTEKYKTKNILLVWNDFCLTYQKTKGFIYAVVYFNHLCISFVCCKCYILWWI